MNSNRLGFWGTLVGAAMVGGVLAGCAGSSSSTQGINPTISATGGVASQSGSPATGVTQSTTPQQVQVTLADGTIVPNANVPAGESFNPADPVGVLPANQPFINGLTIPPSTKRSDGTNTIRPVYVDGQ